MSKTSPLEKGTPAPDFSLIDANGKTVSLADLRGKYIVLFFYPKDDTPTCTNENNDFSNLHVEFKKLNTIVMGISPDTSGQHEKFSAKYGFKHLLLADPDHKAISAYRVWGPKKMMGREYDGVIRTTYLINPNGTVAQSWLVTRAKGHAQNVLEFIRSLAVA